MQTQPDLPPGGEGDTPASLTALLRAMTPADPDAIVTLRMVLTQVGGRSFAPVILVPALILVSPLSAIPGSPTLGMLIIVTIALQAVLGRRHLWLPDALMRRRIAARKLTRALTWLGRPAAFVDNHSRNRLQVLTLPPMDRLVYLVILATALPWPLLEPLPMVTSFGAGAVSLLAIGLMLRDGIYVVLGLVTLGLLGTGALALWQGLV